MSTTKAPRRIRYELAPIARADLRAGWKGRWKFTREGEIQTTFAGKRAALEHATTVANACASTQGQHSTLKIKGKHGRILEERTYPRASDPTTTKG